MKKLPILLAWRYLTGVKKETSISTMVIISFLGIFISSFSLALIVSIMNGFEKVTHEKIQGVNPQILMHSNGQELNFKAIEKAIKNEFPEITGIAPTSIKQLIVQSDSHDQYSIALLKGIDPETEPSVCDFTSKFNFTGKLNSGNKNNLDNKNTHKNLYKNNKPDGQDNKQDNLKVKNLSTILSDNKVIIGSSMAENLNVGIGDQINLFYSSDDKIRGRKIKLEQETVMVNEIFKTGLEEFDNTLIISNFDLFKKIFPDTGITQIGLRLKQGINEEITLKKLKQKFGDFGITCYSWKELYPALVEALKLEKYAMFIILALITLVASMNIISLLFMQIIQKRPDIAILKAMGMPDIQISQIFFYLGMTISFIGAISGLIFAFFAGYILENYPIIKLPDAYYVSYLPAKMDWQIFLTVFVVIILLGFLSTWVPIKRTRKINISQVLRFES